MRIYFVVNEPFLSAEAGTLHFEVDAEGRVEQVYPCRCGVTHRGDHAIYDYGHHNCSHFEKPLFILEEFMASGPPYQALCPCCGASFLVEIPPKKEEKDG